MSPTFLQVKAVSGGGLETPPVSAPLTETAGQSGCTDSHDPQIGTDAARFGTPRVRRSILGGLASAVAYVLPVLAAGALLVAGMTDTPAPYDVTIHVNDPHRVCRAQWCQPGQVARDAEQVVAEQVEHMTAGRDCWTGTRSVTPRTVLVHDVGSTVVREVSFSVGWAAASRGLVWVDGGCA